MVRADFNSYGSRRGHHEVMIRGAFANVRVRNLMLPPKADGSRIEGGYTLLDGQQTTAKSRKCSNPSSSRLVGGTCCRLPLLYHQTIRLEEWLQLTGAVTLTFRTAER